MRAAVCPAPGPPEVVVIEQRDDPVAGPGDAVVAIAAAAVNYPDVLIMDDRYQLRVPMPYIPGSEFAGIVTAVGDGVTDLAVGDRVLGSTMVGAFADAIAVPSTQLTRLPDAIALTDAAAFWVAYATSYHALRSVAEVQPGDKILVLGAAGGVGLAAVELGVVLGGEVIAGASTSDKRALCIDRGAAHAVDYTAASFRDELRAIAPTGVDVVIDPVGGAASEAALRSTRWGGRFVTVGFASGEIPAIPLNLVLLKGVVVKGFEIRTFAQYAPEAEARDRAELMALLADGRISPHVCATYRLEDTAAALRLVADRKAMGKVLITPTPDPGS